jgi:predicted DNA binding CopG/RHH family protein
MVKKANIPGSIEAWEDRTLGASKAHVRKASAETQAAVEDALGMQAISIRLPRSTIDTYKALAAMHGVGYQPLMRDAICRWAEGELKQMVIGAAEVKRQESHQPTPPKAPATTGEHTPPMKRAA